MPSPWNLQNPFMPYFGPVSEGHGPAYWFVFSNSQLLLTRNAAGEPVLPYGEKVPIPEACVGYARLIGTCRQSDCIVVDCAGDFAYEQYGFESIGLRQAADLLCNKLWLIAGRADQILTWHRSHVFCGSCGARLTEKSGEAVKVCGACATRAYPRLAPVVIMAVIRDDAILLGRAPRFPVGMYSTLAGFVEPGETLEGAVAREIGEEVGIEVTDITYVASQPWPFPYSLMVGFTCRYLRGEIRVNRDELEDAAWFAADRLPRLPPRISIARFLIEQFLAEQRKARI